MTGPLWWAVQGLAGAAIVLGPLAFVDWLRHRARRPRAERLPGVPE